MNRIIVLDPELAAWEQRAHEIMVRTAILEPASAGRDAWLRAQRDSGRYDAALVAEINTAIGETN
jgi:hypothetical protein